MTQLRNHICFLLEYKLHILQIRTLSQAFEAQYKVDKLKEGLLSSNYSAIIDTGLIFPETLFIETALHIISD